MTLLNSLLHVTNFRNPFLRTLVPSIATAFALQGAVAVPSILAQSERFYDLSGSLTYLSVTALSLYLPTLRARATLAVKPPFPSLLAAFTGTGGPHGLNWRQVVLSTAVSVWATRLGTYLFQRILADGHDSRFDEIKKSPPKFFGAWMAQATWVSLCLLPILAVNSIPHTLLSTLPLVTLTDVLGLGLFAGGFILEVIADRQKSAWVRAKKAKQHDEDFLTSGLWSKSRHPNYFGESTLWTGLAVAAFGVLRARGPGVAVKGPAAFALCAVSPAFVTFLLLKVSGVPLSEKKYDERYGDRKEYREWKESTPMFIPKL
ncbi:unnamed protein product [Diplocarpon coronariae]|uniref:Uncharacterized protein n=1 Tax=Diplocarpon coronariae TaxID=2795749 RepID=A0A218ZIN7_9HELO|nr:hypothetical protein JHW43_006941 [Diplocarpon mali]OWP07195.1 hypothetical protein B2J93_1968 [Marssonina coronariae]